jgi:hypothetical protein
MREMTEENNSTIGVFTTHAEAEAAVRELLNQGVKKDKISIITKGLHQTENVQGFVTTGDVAIQGAGIGAWTGGLFGLLVGAAFMWVPGFGPLVVAGPLTAALLGAVEGAIAGAMGAGVLGALFGSFVTKKHILKYQEHLSADRYLVVAHGTDSEVKKAQSILNGLDPVEIDIFLETSA